MTSDDQIFESYLPVYDVVPEKWEDSRPFIVEQLKRISNAVNVREIGFFIDEEVLSGKAFIPSANLTGTSQQFRQVLRKVIDFGALPAAGVKAVPHGITFDANFTLVQMFGSATDPVNLFAIPLPYVEILNPLIKGIQLLMDSINVYVVVDSDRSSLTRCFIVIEYMQEL